jgi:hypothetical protein
MHQAGPGRPFSEHLTIDSVFTQLAGKNSDWTSVGYSVLAKRSTKDTEASGLVLGSEFRGSFLLLRKEIAKIFQCCRLALIH